MAQILRSLEYSDLSILHDWLNKPHLRPFYMQEPISSEKVSQKFSPRIGGSGNIKCVIAATDGRPYGYMQWYLSRDLPDYGIAKAGRLAGVSIDYFIGEADFLGRGLGSEMLNTLVIQTCPRLVEQDRIFHILHDDENLPAIRCVKRTGFIAEEAFVENEKQSTLYVRREC